MAQPVELADATPSADQIVPGHILWRTRRRIARVAAISFFIGLVLAFVLPSRYTAVARIMPPEQQGSNGLMMAALASKAGLGNLGSLAPVFFSGHSSTALFIDLLRSGTVSNHLITRFDLQRVYNKRYLTDTAKRLARNTAVADDKRSGVITIQVQDRAPQRARDLAQGYLDELNTLVITTNTSAAHRERLFVEQRLQSVRASLERAQLNLSAYATANGTVDLKEQARGLIDAGARLQAQLLIEQSGLSSLRQVYGDSNIRVREAEASIASLEHDLATISGSRPSQSTSNEAHAGLAPALELTPTLRRLPQLGVAYADLYREVKVQETVFDLLTQQYETARIEEAKDVPVVSVIDPPCIPEKKSFPPRLLLTGSITLIGTLGALAYQVGHARWQLLAPSDPRKLLAVDIMTSLPSLWRRGAK